MLQSMPQICHDPLEAFLKENLLLVESHLDTLVAEQATPYAHLFQAARYSLLGGGKRIRPLLTLAVAHVLQGQCEAALQPACALELIHTYSMIHDDLPAMDDDDFRRGKPALHKAFPEGHAILTGDFLLTYAFEILTSAPLLTATQIVELTALLAKSAGGHGMIAGQIMDISAENQVINLEEVTQIHQTKTGALIVCAVEFGAIIAGCAPSERLLLKQFGENIGLAFQILDDVLDVTSSYLKHGQAISSDLKNKKSTYATLLGVAKAQEIAQMHMDAAFEKLACLPLNTDLLQLLAKKICPAQHAPC